MKPNIISEKTTYKSQTLTIKKAIVKFPTIQTEWEYAISTGGVAVLPLTKNNEVILVKEWRIAWEKNVLSIPSGKCTSTSEKGRLSKVHQEMQEEIGYDAQHVEKLLSFYSSSRIHLEPHVYLATNLFPAQKKRKADEQLTILTLPFEKAYHLFTSGKEPTNSYTLIAFLLKVPHVDPYCPIDIRMFPEIKAKTVEIRFWHEKAFVGSQTLPAEALTGVHF